MVSSFLVEVFYSMLDIAGAPFKELSLLWQLAPIFLVWAVMIFYFGTHKKEKLGWNTAVGNGISLFWIIVSALQHIFADKSAEFTYTKFFLIGIIALYSMIIVYTSFKHSFSDKFIYAIASPTPVYYFSAIVLLYAHNLIALTWSSIVAIAVLFVFVLILVKLVEVFLPEMKEDEDDNKDDLSSNSFDDSFKDLDNGESKLDDFTFNEPTTGTKQPDTGFGTEQGIGQENSFENMNQENKLDFGKDDFKF